MARSISIYNYVDFYDKYIEWYPEDNVDYDTFKAVIFEYHKLIVDIVLNKSQEFILPFGLGKIYIGKYKPKTLTDKSLSYDYGHYKKTGQKIFHLNEHTNGYKFRLFWSKLNVPNRIIYEYGLTLVRANKRLLAKLIKENKNDYIEL